MKIFIGPQEIAGYYKNLSAALKDLGYECDFITYEPHPFGYGGETKIPFLIKASSKLSQFRKNKCKNFTFKILTAVFEKIIQTIWSIKAIFYYDVFIFGFGKSLLLHNTDIPILNSLGKKIIMVMAHGSELRPSYIDGAYQSLNGESKPTIFYIHNCSVKYKKRIVKLETHISYIIGAPFSSTQFTTNKFINFFIIGIPVKTIYNINESINLEKLNTNITSDNQSNNKCLNILHSPSHPAAKGTFFIRTAIQNLAKKGYHINFVELSGRPHDEVVKAIQNCDFIVDQLYSDTPMAGFATEAAWFGKPAIVGGYGLDTLREFVPESMWPPSKICHPDNIEQAIEELIVNPEERLRLGTAAQKFVQEKWSATEVAKRFIRLIEGNIPDEWWLDPLSVTYLEGAGQPVEQSKENIRQMVEKYGSASLQLSHRPELEQAFLEFAGVNRGH